MRGDGRAGRCGPGPADQPPACAPSASQHPREGGLLPQHLLPPQSPGPHLHGLRRAPSSQRPVVLAAVDALQDLRPAQPVSVAPALCSPSALTPTHCPHPSREPCSKRKPCHHAPQPTPGIIPSEQGSDAPAAVGPTQLPGEQSPQSRIIRETQGCACGVQGDTSAQRAELGRFQETCAEPRGTPACPRS